MLFKSTRVPKHLYIHWPFCQKRCYYCDFVAFAQHDEFHQVYHDALCKEITCFAKRFSSEADKNIETIFLGGGTPSLYPLSMLSELFEVLKSSFCLEKVYEVTIEANPEDINEEKLEAWREIGFTRLSMGVQCLNDGVLEKLNRCQCCQDVFSALHSAPKYFNNISIDLILGLPGVDQDSWFSTLEQISKLPIQHVSVYFLTVYEKTQLFFKLQQGEFVIPDDQTLVSTFERTVDFLEECGFEQYEISNFAKKGYSSLHNQAYWNRKQYKGLGVGASSFDGESRFINHNNLSLYLENCCNEELAYEKREVLTREQDLMEVLMLGLRQKGGVDLHRVVYFLSEDKKKNFLKTITCLKNEGFIEEVNNIVRLTVCGMALENEVLLRLL